MTALSLLILTCFTTCGEAKNTTTINDEEEQNSANKKTAEDMKGSVPKVSPDGTINAQLNCKENSVIEAIERSGQTIIPEGFECTISNSSTLKIIFSRTDIILSLEVYEAGSFQIETGEYPDKAKSTTKYATLSFKNLTNGAPNGDLFLEIFEGKVTILDHGMSSNTLCGEFLISDKEGNLFKGRFNEPITSF